LKLETLWLGIPEVKFIFYTECILHTTLGIHLLNIHINTPRNCNLNISFKKKIEIFGTLSIKTSTSLTSTCPCAHKLHNLYSLPKNITLIYSRPMGRAGHAAHMRIKIHTGFWWGNLKEGDSLEDLLTEKKIIFKCTSKKRDQMALNWFICLKTGADGGLF
jgi:hypothetical protein